MINKLSKGLCILVFILTCIAFGFTFSSAKNSMNQPNDFKFNQEIVQPNNKNEQMQPPTNGETKPEMDQNQNIPDKPENEMQQSNMQMEPNKEFTNKQSLSISYILFMFVESVIIFGILFYFMMSLFNKEFANQLFINFDKTMILILSTLLIATYSTIGCTYYLNTTQHNIWKEETNKETKADDVDSGTIVNTPTIDLSQYDENITINKGGEYTLSGEFSHSVLIQADDKVTLHLNNVSIKSSNTAAIANISENDLDINLVDKTTNTLSDGGSSEYDGCIYSLGNLTINGNGTLEVYGNQEEGEGIASESKDITINGGHISIVSNDDGLNAGGDGGTITINNGTIYIKASGDGIDSNKNLIINGGTIYTMGSPIGGDAGIDTDEGFVINGGYVIALGSDMLETPKDSKQNSVYFNLSNVQKENTLITLLDKNETVISSFIADVDFKTLIISSPNIEDGDYTLYSGGENSGEKEGSIFTTNHYQKGEIIEKTSTNVTKKQ